MNRKLLALLCWSSGAVVFACKSSSESSSGPHGTTQGAPRPAFETSLESINGAEWLKHVEFLASDRLEGRGTGTAGCQDASRYIAQRFEEYGLEPGGDFGTYYQSFIADCGRRVLETTTCTVAGTSMKLGEDFAVALGVGKASGSGPLVFVGYGISAADLGQDDYAHAEVEGKIVVAIGGAPGRAQGTGEFLDVKSGAAKALPRAKLEAAFARKAAGFLLIQNPLEAKDSVDALPPFVPDRGAGISFAAVHWRTSHARSTLAAAGFDLDAAIRNLESGTVTELPSGLTGSIVVDMAPIKRTTENVIGILRGHKKHDEAVLIGAHYDHLGRGGDSSLGATGQIHNGADDNASGTAALLELAQACAQSRDLWNRTLVFVAFSAEEIGLLGSLHYCLNPALPLAQTACMLNLDMVGRSRDGYCAVGSVKSAKEFEGLAEAVNVRHGLALSIEPFSGGFNQGSSDHQTFLNQKIPALFFFSGFHEDYHKPSDDVDRVNASGAERIARLVFGTLHEVDAMATRPVFVESAFTAPMTAAGSRGGDRPWFGSVPAMGDSSGVEGVLFDDVRAGSPAEKSGLRKGDRLVEMNGQAVKTLEDFTAMLRGAKVGDTIEVVVLRSAERVRTSVILAVRPQ